MRNFILLFVTALFVGCTSSGVQVTTDDEKSCLLYTSDAADE